MQTDSNNDNLEPALESILGPNPDQWDKPSNLAKLLGIQSKTVRDWIERYPDHLPTLRLPGSYRIRRRDFVAFLKKYNQGEIK